MRKVKKMWSRILGLSEGDLVELKEEVTFLGGDNPIETFKEGTKFRVKRVIGEDILLVRKGRLYLTSKKKVRLVV